MRQGNPQALLRLPVEAQRPLPGRARSCRSGWLRTWLILEFIATDWVFSERQNARKGDKPEPATPRSGALKTTRPAGKPKLSIGMTSASEDAGRCRRRNRASCPPALRASRITALALSLWLLGPVLIDKFKDLNGAAADSGIARPSGGERHHPQSYQTCREGCGGTLPRAA